MAFFILKDDVFHRSANKLNSRGFKILLEIIHRSNEKNIKEIPFSFKPRIHGKSKLGTFVGWNYLLSIYDLVLGEVLPIPFIKFCLVGLAGVFINLLALYLFLHFTHMGKEIALGAAILIAMVFNYIVNNLWTFSKYKITGVKSILKQFIPFFAVCGIGSFINFAVAIVLNEKLGMNLYLANLIGIAIAALWNFEFSARLVWKAKT